MSQYYAILPAAGRSRRMGESKLLLPWPTDERPEGRIIDQVLATWTSSVVQHIIVILRPNDQALAAACSRWPVHIVKPSAETEDMKASVRLGVDFLDRLGEWSPGDIVAISPADVPTLSVSLINKLCMLSRSNTKICVPRFENRRGHPLVIPVELIGGLRQIPDGRGLDYLLEQHDHVEYCLPADLIAKDIDTPAEYTSAIENLKKSKLSN